MPLGVRGMLSAATLVVAIVAALSLLACGSDSFEGGAESAQFSAADGSSGADGAAGAARKRLAGGYRRPLSCHLHTGDYGGIRCRIRGGGTAAGR